MSAPHRVFWGDARAMSDLPDASVHLVVTSPPYWQLKDYGCASQIGWNDSLETYFASLEAVWRECHRVLHGGCRMCINIGDQFARAATYGRYKVIPLHAQIIADAERAGFDFMGQIIWQKVTSQNASGGGAVMGSFPFPRNGIVKLDSEYILLFKKLGDAPKPTLEQKEKSAMTGDEWNRFFAGHWNFAGEKQGDGHIAMFPVELPRRLIRMFSFAGETVLDPFLGSGTTVKAAMECGRIGIGWEINRDYGAAIRARLGLDQPSLWPVDVQFCDSMATPIIKENDSFSRENEARFKSKVSLEDYALPRETGARVREVLDDGGLLLNDGRKVTLRGVRASSIQAFKRALETLTRNRTLEVSEEKDASAYIHLDNRTFLNAKVLRMGVAIPDGSSHPLAARFEKIAASTHV